MINATIREFIGNQAFSANGSKPPFSFTGNQSFLSSIHPSEAALEMNPFSALNCNARPNVKNVGKARKRQPDMPNAWNATGVKLRFDCSMLITRDVAPGDSGRDVVPEGHDGARRMLWRPVRCWSREAAAKCGELQLRRARGEALDAGELREV